MRPIKGKKCDYLFACQKRFGGYTGREIDGIARIFGFSRRTVKWNLEKWSKTDSTFAELKYIGQRTIPTTLEDIAILNQRLKEKITYTKQDLIREINNNRLKRENIPIPQSTLYHIIKQTYPGVYAYEWYPRIRLRSKVRIVRQ